MKLTSNCSPRSVAPLAPVLLACLLFQTESPAAPPASPAPGGSWTTLHTGGDHTVYGSHFIDARHGRVVGWGGLSNMSAIHSTTDGGQTWNLEHTRSTELLFDVSTLDDWVLAVGQFNSNGVIHNSTDGGQSYSATLFPESFGFYGVEMLGAGTAVVCGYNGAMLRTVDGGATWTFVSTPFANSVYRSMSFASDNVGYALGGSAFQGKRVIRTVDGGQTWTSVKNFQSPHVYSDIAAISGGPGVGRRAVLAGYDGSAAVQFTRDGGNTWGNTVTTPNASVLQSIGARGQVVWAGGVTNLVWRSGDGGQTWTTFPTPGPFIGSVSVTEDAVYMGGDNGRVFRRSE